VTTLSPPLPAMSPFAQKLLAVISSPAAQADLNTYLNPAMGYTGRVFETYGSTRTDDFRITGDDLMAITMLSIEVRAKTNSGISPSAALTLEERTVEISLLLAQIPVHAQLHLLAQNEANELLLNQDSPGWRLWDVVLEALSDGGTSRPVATYKLLARKRPHLFSVRDSKTVKTLGNAGNWWANWRNALYNNPAIVTQLVGLRSTAGQNAGHLSLLRVADIVTWMS
jgi:hypothetical protein